MKYVSIVLVGLLAIRAQAQSDAPTFGGSPSRNMVNTTAKNIPIDFSVEEGKHKGIKWVAELGSKAYGGPVIAAGKLYVGTNNSTPRDPKEKGNLAVVQCFDAATGKFLWQITHPMPEDEVFKDVTGPRMGLLSTPAVDGDMLYYVTPDSKVVGATTKGKVAWTFDMMKELKVIPFHCSNSSPLVVDDLVFVLTGNGVNEEGHIASPKAPSFLALNKKTGKVAWQSNLPGDKIIEGQWSNPALAVIKGQKQIIFPGGDGVIYALKPEDGSVIWKFNCYPDGIKKELSEPLPPYFVSTPVVHDNKVFIGMGTYPEHAQAPRDSWFLCIDATKKGDITAKSFDHKAAANKGSGLVWAFGGAINPRPKKGRPVLFGPTLSTAAVHDGLVFITEEAGYFHCLDAKTGERHWMHDFKTAIWGSPYVVDGKVLVGVEDGVLHILKADKKLEVLAEINMEETIHSTPVVANGILYVMPRGKLYAISGK